MKSPAKTGSFHSPLISICFHIMYFEVILISVSKKYVFLKRKKSRICNDIFSLNFKWTSFDLTSEKVGLKLNIQKTKIMAYSPITSWQIDGETVSDFQNHCRWWLQPWNYKTLAPWKESYDQSRQHIQKRRHYFANKDSSSWIYGFSSGHVWMWELDCKESWVPKNWCF